MTNGPKMDAAQLRSVLADVAAGRLDAVEAEHRLMQSATAGLAFAHLDHRRNDRTGFIEVVYCEGKTPEQTAAILKRQSDAHAVLLATRAGPEHARAAQVVVPELEYHSEARLLRRLDPQRRITAAPTFCMQHSETFLAIMSNSREVTSVLIVCVLIFRTTKV